MANGFCPTLLQSMEAVQSSGLATRKLAPMGFLRSLVCCHDSINSPVNAAFGNGHIQPASFFYKNRVTEAQVQDTAGACGVGISRPRLEYTLPSLATKSATEFLEHSLIAQYCRDASECVTLDAQGNSCMAGEIRMPSTMKEVHGVIMDLASAVLRATNTSLVTDMATQFGENVLTGSYNASTITIGANDTALTAAIIELARQLRENEFCGDLCVVGNGTFMNLDILRNALRCCNDAGIDTGVIADLMPNMYYDKATRGIWGENYVGVFEKDAVKLVHRNLYAGNFGGHIDNSYFFTMALPMEEFKCASDCLDNLLFDVRITETACAKSAVVNGYETTVGKGYEVEVSLTTGLFVQPSDMFASGDELEGTNGTLQFDIATS